jgi:hypothetical protein
LVVFSPVDRVTSDVIPVSIPTAAVVAAARAIVSSHSMETNQRPAASWDTVTVDGCTRSGRGLDHTMSSGSRILASVSRPPR